MDKGPTFSPSSGQILTNKPMGRAMRYYPIIESELDALGVLTLQLELFVGAFGFFLSAALTLYLESHLSPEASPQGEVLLETGPWVCIVLSLLCGAVGIAAYIARRNNIKAIKKGAEELFPKV